MEPVDRLQILDLDQQPPLSRHPHLHANASRVTPACSRAVRTARARSTAPGVSPWTQSERTSTATWLAAGRLDPVLGGHDHGAGGHPLGVVQDRPRLPPGHQAALGGVGPVGEPLADGRDAGLPGRLHGHRPGQGEQGQGRVVAPDRLDHGGRLDRVAGDPVVEGAVRLHVADPAAGGLGEGLEGAELVEHVGGELVGRHVDLAPPEADQVGVGDLGADGHPALDRRPNRAVDRRRVARVEPAGHVRAGHHLEEGGIVAEGPAAVPLAEVRVQVQVGSLGGSQPSWILHDLSLVCPLVPGPALPRVRSAWWR